MYLTFKDVAENVFRVHTDGVVMSKKVDLPVGDGIGEWKRVHARVNANVVEWDRGVEVE